MRPTLRLAASMAAQSSSLKPAAMNLLPPIPLYRRLLRAHRKHLPHEMRVLGDEYVKAEFRAHRNVDNPVHLVSLVHGYRNVFTGTEGRTQWLMLGPELDQVGFLSEWQLYAQKIEGDAWVGEKLDQGKIEKMSGEWPGDCNWLESSNGMCCDY